MGSQSKISGIRIKTKLLAINALICTVFILIVLMIYVSSHHIQVLLRSVIIDDAHEVTTNALTERELSAIMADTNLLLNTFFGKEAYLNINGNRLLTYTLVLVGNNQGRDIEQPLQVFAQRLGLILKQCRVVNASIRKLEAKDHDIMAMLTRLEGAISQKLIDMAFAGDDTSILEQLSVLVAGYRQSLFKIGKLHAQTFPEKFYAPISSEKDLLVVTVDELILRIRTLMASEPDIAELGRKLLVDLQTYRAILLSLNKEMVELKLRINAIDNAKEQVAAVMEKLDRDVAQTTKAVDTQMTKSFRAAEIGLLFISVSLVVALSVLTAIFFKSIIKDPMDKIQEGISAFRGGNLDARISLNRKDEWHLIENAMNTMAADLSASYTDLQEAHDDLEIKVMERTAELSEAKEKALETQHAAEAANQSKSEFLARMSHEIRTPLNAVTGLTTIVLKSSLTVEQRDYLNKVKIASNNLLEVINDILDFSKVEAGRLELTPAPFNLDLVLEQLADLFSNRTAQKDLELIMAVSPQTPRKLTGDAGRLNQVLTNLIENAVKFTETGEIVVNVEPDDSADVADGQVVLRFKISDTGSGIAPQVLPILFEPFTQAEGYLTRQHEGSGLGLAICRRLVELMDGAITAESTPGRGSTFTFTVKLVVQTEDAPILSSPSDIHGLKILVVDDSESARQVLCDMLESLTFSVAAVESGEKAIEELHHSKQNGPYQLVLIDWKMPGMDGIEAARRIRELASENRNSAITVRPESPAADTRSPSVAIIIILVTAYGHELVQAHMDDTVVDAMLLKPVKPSQLLDTIMNLLGRKEAATVSRARKVLVLPPRHLSGRRVLVVEDSALNRDVAVTLLEEAGLVVETAVNGRIAVDKVAQSSKGFYDAVFMDIQMPEMDGYEATLHIRQWESDIRGTNVTVNESSYPSPPLSEVQSTVNHSDNANSITNHRLPIIALTAHALKGEKEKCLAAEMDDYLSKPIDEQELHRVLLTWIMNRQQGESDRLNRTP